MVPRPAWRASLRKLPQPPRRPRPGRRVRGVEGLHAGPAPRERPGQRIGGISSEASPRGIAPTGGASRRGGPSRGERRRLRRRSPRITAHPRYLGGHALSAAAPRQRVRVLRADAAPAASPHHAPRRGRAATARRWFSSSTSSATHAPHRRVTAWRAASSASWRWRPARPRWPRCGARLVPTRGAVDLPLPAAVPTSSAAGVVAGSAQVDAALAGLGSPFCAACGPRRVYDRAGGSGRRCGAGCLSGRRGGGAVGAAGDRLVPVTGPAAVRSAGLLPPWRRRCCPAVPHQHFQPAGAARGARAGVRHRHRRATFRPAPALTAVARRCQRSRRTVATYLAAVSVICPCVSAATAARVGEAEFRRPGGGQCVVRRDTARLIVQRLRAVGREHIGGRAHVRCLDRHRVVAQEGRGPRRPRPLPARGRARSHQPPRRGGGDVAADGPSRAHRCVLHMMEGGGWTSGPCSWGPDSPPGDRRGAVVPPHPIWA